MFNRVIRKQATRQFDLDTSRLFCLTRHAIEEFACSVSMILRGKIGLEGRRVKPLRSLYTSNSRQQELINSRIDSVRRD